MGAKRARTKSKKVVESSVPVEEEEFAEGSEDDNPAAEVEDSLPSSTHSELEDDEAAASDGDVATASGEEDDDFLGDVEFERHDDAADASREGYSDDSDVDPPQSRGAKQQKGSSNSLASAFAEILAHPGPANRRDEAPILLGSKSLAKRAREEQVRTDAQKAAKRLRTEMKQRGHSAVARRGEDPEHDAAEKALLKTATRGVVQLFNAVSKAQKKRQEALEAGAKEKGARINKASFFSELRGQTTKGTAPLIGPSKAELQKSKGLLKSAAEDPEEGGWDILRRDFGGLQGDSRLRMKDWDMERLEEDDLPEKEALSGSESELEGVGAW